MIKEHDRIVLTTEVPDVGLKAGDVGTIVHVHTGGEAFEVEFFTLAGKTAALATVRADQIRPITPRDLTHARPMEVSA